MAPGDTARLYHRLTSYTPERDWKTPVDDPRVVQGFKQIDIPTFPAACKVYPRGLRSVALPNEWPAPDAPAAAVLAGRAPAGGGALDLAALARVLHLSAGVVRVSESPDGRRYLLRAVGSAGGRFPLEVYVAARGVGWLEDGVHWYDAPDHALVRGGPAPGGGGPTPVGTRAPPRPGRAG